LHAFTGSKIPGNINGGGGANLLTPESEDGRHRSFRAPGYGRQAIARRRLRHLVAKRNQHPRRCRTMMSSSSTNRTCRPSLTLLT
jgi:hypothetical protein